MQVNTSTYSSNAAATASASSASTTAGSTLSETQFLQLLTKQLENQDPLQPEDDTQFLSQMAQFTALQQSTDMSSSLSMLQANSLVGSNVTLQVDSQNTTSGVVQGVQLGASSSDGKPQIVVNGTAYDLSQVLSITPPATTQTPATSSSSPATN